jgi:hypothetical protein
MDILSKLRKKYKIHIFDKSRARQVNEWLTVVGGSLCNDPYTRFYAKNPKEATCKKCQKIFKVTSRKISKWPL